MRKLKKKSKREKELIILLFKIDVQGLTRQQVEEQIYQLMKDYEFEDLKNDYNIKQIWLPTRGTTDVKVIYPVAELDDKLIKAIKVALVEYKTITMQIYKARKLAQYHKFTKIELYQILVEALATHTDEYWLKPNGVNKIFDNGYYFNQCRKWIDYQKGVNENDECSEIVVVRVLQTFGKFSKIQLPQKIKPNIELKVSKKPKL